MIQPDLTTGAYLKRLKLLHTALLLGQVLFCIIAVVVLSTTGAFNNGVDDMHGIFKFLVPAMVVAGFAGSVVVFKKKLDELNAGTQNSLRQRLQQYQGASIVRWAMLEGPVLISIIGLLLTGNYYYYVPFIFIMLVFFVLYTPSVEKIKMQVQMSSGEQALLDDHYAQIP